MTMKRCEFLRGIVFDWAGTTIDHGSLAPARVFQEVFARRGVTVTVDQAREPMGRAKRDHIATVAAMAPVEAQWHRLHQRAFSEEDIDAMYADFLPLQKEILDQYTNLIKGTADVVQSLRAIGLQIGSSTGYTRELMEVVSPAAKRQGYEPDFVLCAEDAPQGRPAPFLLFHAAMRMGVYPMWRIIKVDDTVVGVEAGRNAGCWTIGIIRTGNGLGLSAEEVDALGVNECQTRCSKVAGLLTNAGADYCIESVEDLLPIIESIEQRMLIGDRPTVG